MLERTTVCERCGLAVSFSRSREKFFHVEEPQDKTWEPHDVPEVVTRREYLFGQAARPEKKTPAERQADALERIADVLESLRARPMDS